MAKKKKAKKASARGKSDVVEMMRKAKESALGKKGVGGSLYTAKEHRGNFVGVPLPSLALEVLMNSNLMLLGMVYGVSGPRESFKSTLCLALGQIIAQNSGVAFMAETEGGKLSPAMVESMWGGELASRLLINSSTSLEEAQSFLTWTMDYVRKQWPKKDQMVAVLLDSLSGPAAAERHKKISESGSASRDYAIEANLWTRWLQTYTSRLMGWPMSFFFVNHEKKDINSKNAHAVRRPGGDAQEYYSALYISTKRIKTTDVVDGERHQLILRTVKSSFGPSRDVSLLVVVDKSSGTAHLRFDWHSSTAHLLLNAPEAVKDACPMSTTSENICAITRRFSCKPLGLVKVTAEDFGEALYAPENEAVLEGIRATYCLERYKEWDGVMPVITVAGPDDKMPPESDDINVIPDEGDMIE